MSKQDSHHVVPHGDQWAVKRGGSERVSSIHNTQEEAIQDGRRISQNQGTELFIHRPNGQIRERDSHGHDPYPPKG